jgi:NAD(P)-dependent dehydrogenase (short-subunit alcohol dehydrogenase family)
LSGNRVVSTEVRMRLKDKIAIVVGAGQSPGGGLGNGRATVLRFAQEGAKVVAVDYNLSSAEVNGRNGTTVGWRMPSVRSRRYQRDHSRGDGRGRTATLGAHRCRVSVLSFRSMALWTLGYPEAALADAANALKDAREISQAVSHKIVSALRALRFAYDLAEE